jgi:hypothetical protein
MAVALTESNPRSLLPQEHGAWGQLAMPLLSGLAIRRPTLPALLIGAATVLAFLAHEPWLVALGHRGLRAREQDGPRALRAMIALLAAAGAVGAAGLSLAPGAARWGALLPGLLAAVVLGMVLTDRERTIAGELSVSTALAAAGALLPLASGGSFEAAGAVFATWSIAFGTTVFAVQVVLLGTRSRGEQDKSADHAFTVIAVAATGSALWMIASPSWAVPVAVLPTALVSLGVCLARPGAARLRFLGWSLVVATTATLVLLLVWGVPR